MRAVKLFNVVAGILLIVGSITLVVSLIFREPPKEAAIPAKAPALVQKGALPDQLDLGALAGSQIIASELNSSHALITTQAADGVQQLFLVELASGRVSEIRADGS